MGHPSVPAGDIPVRVRPYYVGEADSNGGGPGNPGCTPLSSLEDKRLTPLVSVGRITLVNPTSNQGWLGWLPLGYQVFRSKHPPHSESTALWIRTADDCYVGAAPEYIV